MSAAVTSELVRQDGAARVAKTGGQVGGSAALVTVGLFVAHQAGWRGEMPAEVVAACTTLLSILAAFLTNWSRLKAK